MDKSHISNNLHGLDDTIGLNNRLNSDLCSGAHDLRFEADMVELVPFTKGVVSSVQRRSEKVKQEGKNERHTIMCDHSVAHLVILSTT